MKSELKKKILFILLSICIFFFVFEKFKKKELRQDSNKKTMPIKHISINDEIYIQYKWIKEKIEVKGDLKIKLMNILNGPPDTELEDFQLLLDSRKYLINNNEKFIINNNGLTLLNAYGYRFWIFKDLDKITDKIMGVESGM